MWPSKESADVLTICDGLVGCCTWLTLGFLLPSLWITNENFLNTLMMYWDVNYTATLTLVHHNSRRYHRIFSGTSFNRCIRQHLQKDLNIPSQCTAAKPLLTPHIRKKCLQFARRYFHWSVADRKKVLWFDESTFQCIQNWHLGVRTDTGIFLESRC